MAANDNSSSTFAFIGPQRYNRWGHGDVLYVGTTFTQHGDYRHDVPAIATRNLHDLSFAEYSFSKQSLLRIDVKFRDRFLVNYAYGFNSSDHAYFVVVQKRSHVAGDEERGYVTRLARTCVSDPNFDTYAEVTLECVGEDGSNMDILTAATLHEAEGKEPVLYGAFSNTMASTGRKSKSGICSYSMSNIEKLFEENIHHCFNGSMVDRNLEYVSGPVLEGKCPSEGSRGNINDFCKVGIKISGKFPIRSPVVWEVRDRITSMASDQEDGQVVLLAGTESGKIKESTIEPGAKRATPLEQYSVRSGPVLQLLAMERHLVFLTPGQVGKFPLARCNKAESCQSCAALPSPYCRWCPRSNTCESTRGGCAGDDSQLMGECVQIDRISPPEMSRDLFGKEVYVHMAGLPAHASLSCSFSDAFVSPAKRFDGGVSCAAPPFHDVSDLDEVKLSVQLSEGNTSLASAAMPVINCLRASQSCESCVSLSHACRWCHAQSACLHHTERGCPSDSLANTCPLINQRDVRVPNGHPSQVEVDFAYLPAHFREARLYCMVNVEGAKMKIPAHVEGRVVVCERRRYSYISEQPELSVEAEIVTEAGLVLDSTNITLFKCEVMGTYRKIGDCSLCLRASQTHGCAWCGSKCVFSQQCPQQKVSKKCPKPEIYFVSPTRGPLEGGTVITLDGINLPAQLSRRVSVRVGGKECRSAEGGRGMEEEEEITCLTPSASFEQNAPIDMESSEGKSRAAVGFQYVDFAVSSASPSSGPLSGGVSLSVSGSNLDIGSTHAVFLDRVPCHIHNLSRARDNLVCYVSAADRPTVTRNLTVKIDGAVRTVPFDFEFLPDPVVLSVKPLQSYFSGGRPVAFHGKFFSGLREASMLIYDGDSEDPVSQTECEIRSDRLLECPSPALTLSDDDDNEMQARLVSVGLKAGNVTRLLRLSEGFPRVSSDMEYFPDPEYFNVSTGYTIYDRELLVIEGHHLSAANDVTDVQVHVGSAACNVTSITSSQLLCVPPDSRMLDASSARPLVTASHNLKFDLGPVAFEGSDSDDALPEIFGVIGAIIAMLIFMAVAGCVLFKRKSSESEREYKRIQIQMDLLEHNVRSECKQAFAELQTDMTGLTMDMETAGIPFYPRKTFLVKMFFPGVHDHPVILPQFEMWPTAPKREGGFTLQQVEELLLNKWFLLALIDLVENQMGVSVKERINFASLISVVLSTRMAYFSDILKTLLESFLNSAMNSRHADSTFRRSDSVVEKLLNNWLSICLYDYISDEVGPPLFLLSKAIKCQVEKGPVDALTHEARYSLSESGLLRQSCECAPVSCLVLQRELDEAYECRVLDADSVTQVKGKILDAVYKNTPFSLRPRVEEVDLEWQCGQDAHVILQDVDLTTETDADGCYRKVNTLRHYGIKNKAVVSLVPKQFQNPESPYRSTKDLGLYHLRIPPPKSSSSSAPSTSSSSASSRSSSSHYATVARDARGNIPEVYLTRLLATKGTLKKFVDDFIASTTRAEGRFPSTLKWLFDLLDEAASRRHGFAQSLELSHAWKFNSVYHCLWVPLLRSPDLVYDVERTAAMENNLSVVAQVLQSAGAGAFSATSPPSPVGREAPYHKLLFAREISEYRSRLQDFFSTVRRLSGPTEFELDCHLGQLSSRHQGLFNQAAALEELSLYVGASADRLCDMDAAAARAVRDVKAAAAAAATHAQI